MSGSVGESLATGDAFVASVTIDAALADSIVTSDQHQPLFAVDESFNDSLATAESNPIVVVTVVVPQFSLPYRRSTLLVPRGRCCSA